jgi:4-hydroxy-tetrahydrodipicolinate synthase
VIKSDAALFGRVVTAMVTPFDDSSKLDLKAAERLVRHLLDTGTTSILVAGTTGESPTLEDSERSELLKCVLDAADHKAKVIMGTGSNSTAKSVQSSQEAERLGADGLLVVAPYYNKPSQQGLVRHYSEVAQSTSLPIIIYNIPSRTGINVTAETTLTIAAQNKNIYALKDSTGSVEQAAEIAAHAADNFRIYSGDDYLTLPFLSIGACGIVSVASHVVGAQIAQMIDLFFAGKLDQARSLHYTYLPLFKGLFAAPNPVCVKYAMSILGICKEHLRLPLVALEQEQKDALTKLLRQSGVAVKSTV